MKHPHLYLITEFCEKGNVQSILRDKKTKLSLKKIIGLALGAAKGMLYLHSSDPPILHRDLKSANLLVDKNWTCKVGDFGMSRVMDKSKSMTVCGTAETCAPEVLARSYYTESADVYSFGIVLWEMLTREVLYPGMNFYELSSKVVNENMRPPTAHKNFPPELLELMTTCWRADPEKRPHFKQVVSVLDHFHDTLVQQKQRKQQRVKQQQQEQQEQRQEHAEYYKSGGPLYTPSSDYPL